MPGREVPQVADADVVDEVAPFLVNGGDAGPAGEHVRPLGLLVPVHLANTAGFEAHVHAGELVAMGSSRTVTSRAQPPVRRRLRAAAKENLRLGIVPLSV